MKKLHWRIHTPNLIGEILNNRGCGVLRIPIKILGFLLAEVGERASEINDPKLNELMARLTIYSVADPESKDYNGAITEKLLTRKSP